MRKKEKMMKERVHTAHSYTVIVLVYRYCTTVTREKLVVDWLD